VRLDLIESSIRTDYNEMIVAQYLLPFIILLAEGISFPVHRKEGRVESVQQKTNPDCSFNGYNLYGRVKIVESFPDIKVQIVTSFPDLKVKVVDYQPSGCGEWKMVNEFPDLKVQFVTSFPDIKILYVQSFPGLTNSKLK